MITINSMRDGHPPVFFVLSPTIFPDKTSQVWHLPDEIFNCTNSVIVWDFENETEVVHFCQLCTLLNKFHCKYVVQIPYLPYARQDKEISNDSTFALLTFLKIIREFVDHIYVCDMHNPDVYDKLTITNIIPVHRILSVIDDFKPDYILFPDIGAKKRYAFYLCGTQKDLIYAEKVRDQTSGNIVGINVPHINDNSSVLIIDDICDGGATFVRIAEHIKTKVQEIKLGLYVTHGIFSRGLNPLFAAGFSNIYTLDEDLVCKT